MEMERLKTAMKTSISEVLETMFFLPLDFPEHNVLDDLKSGPQDNPLLASKIEFKGPVRGEMFFLIPWNLARGLTANFLGIEEQEVDIKGAEETVKELLNMITGKAFSLYDDQLVMELGIPDVVEADLVLTRDDLDAPNSIALVPDTVDAKLGLLTVIKD